MAGLSSRVRVLITGASGFIGRRCVARLTAQHCEVHAVNLTGSTADIEGAVWHRADLRDPKAARSVVKSVSPTHLLHLAWEATPRSYSQSEDNLRWLQASLAMVSAFGEAGGLRFVGAGSSAEYEPGHPRCIEDQTPIRPLTIYGKCKAACWLGIEAAGQLHGFSAAWGRVFLVYGPGDAEDRLITSVQSALVKKRPITITDPQNVRDFVYVADVADLLVHLLFSSESGAFNIGTGCGTSVLSIIEYLTDCLGGHELVRLGSTDFGAGSSSVLVADTTKVRQVLGWSAPTSVHAGLQRLLGNISDSQSSSCEGRITPRRLSC